MSKSEFIVANPVSETRAISYFTSLVNGKYFFGQYNPICDNISSSAVQEPHFQHFIAESFETLQRMLQLCHLHLL